MRLKILFLVSVALLAAGLICLGQGVNGNFNVTAALPVSSTAIRLCVTVAGWWAVVGGPCTLLGAVLLATAIGIFVFSRDRDPVMRLA